MRFWGITGTNGKTTCTWITAAFIDAVPGRKCGYVTTVEVYDGERRFHTGYTTPPLKQLHEIFAAMAANGCTDCVMEVSSHAIHQHRTGDTVFSGGAFTNLSEDHLDYHRTMAAYFDVKLDFSRWCRDVYVVGLDGGYGREMYEAVSAERRAVAVSWKSCGYDLSRLRLIGDYNKANVAVAAALAEGAGVERETIQRVIPTLEPRWGRLERVENERVAATVYVDFAHTPDGLEKVLTAVRGEMSSPSSSLWIVFGAGGDRDPMKRPLMGEACARLADRLVVTSDNPRSEEPMAIIDQILSGVKRRASVHVEPDRAKAIAHALANAAAGDVVIIAGKGHETTQEVKGVKHPFDDREQVRKYGSG